MTRTNSEGLPALDVRQTVGSTNDVARRQALAGAPHGYAVVADTQTEGRGRRGHQWVSPPGNLYVSVLLRPRADARLAAGLGAACALGVLDALDAVLGVPCVQLKWPNDLVARGRKLGGILVELCPGGAAVCGVGINLLAPRVAARGSDEPTALEAGSLREVAGPEAELDRHALSRAVQRHVVARVDTWDAAVADEPLAPLLEAYLPRLAWVGRAVEALAPTGAVLAFGSLEGVDAWGRAVVRCADGQRVCLMPEQASLRPLFPGGAA